MPSLTEAIYEKYDSSNLDVSNTHSFITVFVPKSGPHTSDECDKPSLPPRLTLDNLEINTAGDGPEILDLCSHVRELDLTKNCITQWKEVFTILEHMPCLQFLNLTLNSLDDTSLEGAQMGTFPSLQDLALNDTGVSWSSLAKLLQCFPSLTELHVSLNKYQNVDLPQDFRLHSLTKLFMNSCDIDEWSEISKLGVAFPSLQSLNIIQTQIRNLSDEELFTEFPELKALNISNSKLESWEEVDKFRHFPSLTSLRIFDVPSLEEMEGKQRRQHLVARLPNVSQLNGSDITETEREDAERAFIRHFMDSTVKPDRFYELEQKYGKLDPLAKVDLAPQQHLNMKVTFEDKVEYMDIYLRQTVGELKKFLQNFTGIPPSRMRLYYIENLDGKSIGTTELMVPRRSLLNINMNVGDEFIIDRK